MACCSEVPTAPLPDAPIEAADGRRLRLGSHVHKIDTLMGTLTQSWAIPCPCIQVYLGGNTNYSVPGFRDKDQAIDYCAAHNKTIYFHAPVIINLCSDKQDVVEKGISCIQKELNVMEGLPGAVVMHCGRIGTEEQIAESIGKLEIKQTLLRRSLLLENGAGQGGKKKGSTGPSEKGSTWDSQRKLCEALDHGNRIGFCGDTQHLFAAGMCDFDSHESVVKLYDQVEEIGRAHV